jgi:hypothetical protein
MPFNIVKHILCPPNKQCNNPTFEPISENHTLTFKGERADSETRGTIAVLRRGPIRQRHAEFPRRADRHLRHGHHRELRHRYHRCIGRPRK